METPALEVVSLTLIVLLQYGGGVYIGGGSDVDFSGCSIYSNAARYVRECLIDIFLATCEISAFVEKSSIA